MKTHRSRARIPAQIPAQCPAPAPAQSAARVRAQSSPRVRAQKPRRQLVDIPDPATLQILLNASVMLSGARKNVEGQLSRVWKNTSGTLSRARKNVEARFSQMRKSAAEVISTARRNVEGQLARGWRSLRAQQAARSTSKRLRVAATVSLGEKRFIAVIQVDGREFLVGGGATNVALLAPLNARESFDALLSGEMKLPDMTAAKKQPARRASKKAAMPVAAMAVAKKQPAKRVSKPIDMPGVKQATIARKHPAKRISKPIAKPLVGQTGAHA